MKCPICTDSTLVIAERAGIEIDHCPNCRGVWLDRGELDKIIERNRTEPARFQEREERDERGRDRDDDRHESKYRRKRSFLEDLFD